MSQNSIENTDSNNEEVAFEVEKLAKMLEEGSIVDMGDDKYILDAKKEILIRAQARKVYTLLFLKEE